MAVHLAVACDVFDGVLFVAVLFFYEIWDSVPVSFPTYFSNGAYAQNLKAMTIYQAACSLHVTNVAIIIDFIK